VFWKLKAWYYGRRDGILGMPPRDEETPAPFEQRVCAAAERTVSAIHRKWKAKDARLSGENRDREDVFKRAFKNYETKRSELGRDTTVGTMLPYYFILLLIGICEFAVNIVVFRILGENTVFTGLMAIVIFIGLPLVGHHVGKSLKHGWQSLTDWILYPVEIIITAGGLIAFAVVRRDYIANTGQNFLSINVAVWTFIALNLLLFVGAVVASYMAHDKDPDIYRFKKRYEQTQKPYHDIGARRLAWRDKMKGHAEEIKNSARTIIMLYRDHNMRRRMKASLKEMPISFKREPIINIPSFEFEEAVSEQAQEKWNYESELPAAWTPESDKEVSYETKDYMR